MAADVSVASEVPNEGGVGSGEAMSEGLRGEGSRRQPRFLISLCSAFETHPDCFCWYTSSKSTSIPFAATTPSVDESAPRRLY